MANVKKDKYDLLVSVIEALGDDNQKAEIETTNLDADKAKKYAWNIVENNNPQIPTKQGSYKTGIASKNREHAQSIKIGKFSMRRMPDGKYILRTPEGDAEFSQNDKDFVSVWSSVLSKADINYDPVRNAHEYDGKITDVLWGLEKQLKDVNLKKAIKRKFIDKKSKFDKAKENLKSLGIEKNDEELKKRLAMIQNKYFEK